MRTTFNTEQACGVGYMEKEAFRAWAKDAKERCARCRNGEIPFEEFKKWLDESSRQRK